MLYPSRHGIRRRPLPAERALQRSNEEAVAVQAQLLLARMHDLSEFMKTLKQRFSIWYNRNHDNRLGTLWMDRFKSVLVEEGQPFADDGGLHRPEPSAERGWWRTRRTTAGVAMRRRWREI